MIFIFMFMHNYIINPAGLFDISLHVHSYILTLGTQLYDYLPMYVHSYIHAMHTYVMHHVYVMHHMLCTMHMLCTICYAPCMLYNV